MSRIKTSRAFSFLAVFAVYLLAAAAGTAAFFALASIGILWIRVLLCDCLATLVVFLFATIFDNASVYDPYWSVQPMVIVPCVLASGGSFSVYSAVLIVLIELWGVRLTANWAYLFENLSVQDWRYTNLKNSTGKWYPLVNLLGIHLVPTLIVFFCLLPVLQFSLSDGSGVHALCLIGAAVSIAGIVLEIAADLQKHMDRRSGGRGIVNTGIWKKHRHPNYLGEILFWWGIYLFVAAVSPDLWWTGAGALLNTLLFALISIPMAEKQTKLRHPDEWEAYKNSSFVV